MEDMNKKQAVGISAVLLMALVFLAMGAPAFVTNSEKPIPVQATDANLSDQEVTAILDDVMATDL